MMKNMMKNFYCGPIKMEVGLSHLGVCVENNDGALVSFDKKTSSLIDVSPFELSANGSVFQIPVAISKIAVGDAVVHSGDIVFVTEVNKDNNKISAIVPVRGEEVVILPTKSMFGFDFVPKVVSMFDGLFDGEAASSEDPFGKMLPLMMMGGMGESGDNNPMAMLMMMKAMGGDSVLDMSDPMTMMMMMGGFNGSGGSNDINPFMAMMMMKSL